MAQFVRDGVVYEDLGDGNVRVVGYADAPEGGQPAPITVGTPKPKEPEKPQNIQRKDGSIVQVYPDGRIVEVSGPVQAASSGVGNTKATAAQRTEAIQGFNDAAALRNIAKELRQRFEQGPGATQGVAAIQDFLPTATNRGFDSAAQRARGYVKRSLGFTGGEGNTVAESTALYDPYLPSASDYDSSILDKINALEELATLAETKSVSVLGGRPDATGNIVPVGQAQAVPQQLATGETRREVDPVASGIIDRMIRQGKSADEINAVLGPLGFNPVGPGDVSAAQDYLRKNPNYDKSVGRAERILPIENPTLNAALQTGPGTAAATYLNAGGFGVPQALNPQAFEALREESPGWAFAGDVGGIITGTGLIGKAGQQTIGRVLPAAVTNNPTTLQKFANFGRQLAPDAAYGAAYGGITEGDPLTGAATATLGSAGGQVIGKGIQKGFQGVSDPAVQYLTQRGIPLSLGETLGNNSIVGRQMQRMESIPILGDLMSARRGEARDAVYRGVLEDAVQPIGGRIDPTDPLASAQQAISGAYDNAVGNVTVPFDARYFDELGNARNAASTLPPDLKGKFDAAMASRVDPISGQASPRTTGPLYDAWLGRSIDPAATTVSRTKDNTWKLTENGDDIGSILLMRDQSTGDVLPSVNLASIFYNDLRGKGLIGKAYEAAEKDLGRKLIPSPEGLSEGATGFWKKRFSQLSPEEANALLSEGEVLGQRLGIPPNEVAARYQPLRDAIGTGSPSQVTGQQYQQAMRGLSGYKSEATKPGFEQDYRDAISMVQDALKGQMMRGGGDTVVTGLRNADQAYSMLKPIQNATISARGTPTPKQLQAAFTTNTKKFGGDAAAARGDKVPDIVRYAVNNAPNIGNSGTADRLAGIMPFLWPTALGGSAAGIETFTDSPFLTGSLATLAALSTRTGQKAMQAALVKRPAAVRKFGGLFGGRKAKKGLSGVGVATAPLLIEQ